MEWISVTDRLPDIKGEYVLVYFPFRGRKIYMAYWDKYETLEEFVVEHSHQNLDKNGFDQTLFFTHWMPIPKPPKQ